MIAETQQTQTSTPMPTIGATLRIQTPRAALPLLKSSRYKGLYGGRGGAKSHTFADLLLERCLMYPGTRAVCIREYQVSLEQSVKRLLEDKLKAYGLLRLFKVLNTHIETPGGGIIIFQGMQSYNADSIKSLESYDIAWVEEAQNFSQRSLDLLRPTIRKDAEHERPQSELWFSWNPSSATDPVDKFLRQNPPPDALVLNVSWRDNPFFPAVLRREMEYDLQHDVEKYAHIWGGTYETHSTARVFKNWRVEDLVAPPNTVFYYGGDWGFSVDPTVLVRSWFLDEHTVVIDAEAYQVGCEIDDTPTLFDGIVCGCTPESVKLGQPCRQADAHGIGRQWQIRADSARPETISYLRNHGYPYITPAIKGPNSVKEGVIFLQGYTIILRPRCQHTIDEFTHYSYIVDRKTGVVTPLLEDKKNHVIDSVRYSVELVRGADQAEKYGFTSAVTW